MSTSLENSFDSLRRALAGLQETISALHVTVIEDKPKQGAVVLVDQLDTLVVEMSSTLEEAEARAVDAVRTCKSTADLDESRSALCEVHRLVNRFSSLHAGELASYDRIAQLLAMGRERGREWRQWSQVVKVAIDRCSVPMNTAASALLQCWSELAERMARNSVSVNATNIGQQISLREDQLELTSKIT
jgi:hypothetical protein